MPRFDHLSVPVASYSVSKSWYVEILGLDVEFDMAAHKMVAVRDTHDFTLFLYEGEVPANPTTFMFTFSVEDVHAFHQSRTERGIAFIHEPKMVDWGFGAELRDPNGYRIAIWDELTMPKTR